MQACDACLFGAFAGLAQGLALLRVATIVCRVDSTAVTDGLSLTHCSSVEMLQL